MVDAVQQNEYERIVAAVVLCVHFMWFRTITKTLRKTSPNDNFFESKIDPVKKHLETNIRLR